MRLDDYAARLQVDKELLALQRRPKSGRSRLRRCTRSRHRGSGDRSLPGLPRGHEPQAQPRHPRGRSSMSYITRERVHVDRIATAWAIRNFIDPRPRSSSWHARATFVGWMASPSTCEAPRDPSRQMLHLRGVAPTCMSSRFPSRPAWHASSTPPTCRRIGRRTAGHRAGSRVVRSEFDLAELPCEPLIPGTRTALAADEIATQGHAAWPATYPRT